MLIYYALFGAVALLTPLMGKTVIRGRGKIIQGNLFYMYIVATVLILIMGLRATTVGCDVIQYVHRYEMADSMLKLGFTQSEWGFNYLSFFFHDILKVDFQFFLFFISCACVLSTCYYIYRYSDDVFVSLMIYLTVGNFTVNMSGLRQTVAISLIMVGMIQIERRHLLKYLALVFLATLMHNSAIIALPLYFLWGIRLNRKTAVAILVVTLMAFFYRNLLNPIISLLSPQRYSNMDLSEGYSINILVLLVPIVFNIYSLAFMQQVDRGAFNVKNSFFYMCSCISVFMMILSLGNNQIGRLAYYFACGNVIISASAIKNHCSFDRATGRMIKVFIIILCVVYFLYSTPGGTLRIDDYHFFWES